MGRPSPSCGLYLSFLAVSTGILSFVRERALSYFAQVDPASFTTLAIGARAME